MKLSIITINYNNRIGLQKTIDSVINQTWKDYEWIIIDGGSTDGSRELIEQYQQYLVYWCSEPDDGVYYAMNKGIAMANGYYLNFMNSGDTFHNKEVLYKVFNSTLYGDVVYGNWYILKKEKSYLKKPPIYATLDFFYADNICHQAMFIKTSILKEKAYDVDFQIYADWARWINMYIQGSIFQYLPIVICQYDAICGKSNRETIKCREEYERLHELFPSFIRALIKRKILLQKESYAYRFENDTKTIQNLPMGVVFRKKVVLFEIYWYSVLIGQTSKAMRRFNKLFHKLLIDVHRFKCNMLNIRHV